MYKLFGSEISPYSIKVSSYLKYKNIKFKWNRNPNSKEINHYDKDLVVPLLLSKDKVSIQDSTLIIEKLERTYKSDSIFPEDSRLIFLSALLEEYADEWMNKYVFHYRWSYEADQNLSSKRMAAEVMPLYIKYLPVFSSIALDKQAEKIKRKMVNSLSFIGSNKQTKNQIENSFKRLIDLLEKHFSVHQYLFGGRPAIADFAFWGQLYNCWMDITARNFINQRPNLVKWLKRMEKPKVLGDFVGWSDVYLTLEPIFEKEVAGLFLPWSDANDKAQKAKKEDFSVFLENKEFNQKTKKDHSKSLKELRFKYNEYALKESIKPILINTGCLKYLGG